MAGISNLHVVDTAETPMKSAFARGSASTTGDIANQLIASLQTQVASLAEQNHDLRQQLSREREHSRAQADRITEMASEMAKMANDTQQNLLNRLISRGFEQENGR